jgi:hypothetical protein
VGSSTWCWKRLRIRQFGRARTAAYDWALSGSVARLECVAQPGAWSAASRGQVEELWHCQDGACNMPVVRAAARP